MKPDWAQGPEWDGWRFDRNGWAWKSKVSDVDHQKVVTRVSVSEEYHSKTLTLMFTERNHINTDTIYIAVKSPEHARKAAEALLEAME